MKFYRHIARKFNASSARIFGFFMNLYPPFVFFGVKVRFSPDFYTCNLRISNRFYFKNGHGTMFGGAILAATDPIPAVQLSRILRYTQVWTKAHEVVFKKPARTSLRAEIQLSDQQLSEIKEFLRNDGKCVHVFHYSLFDKQGDVVAEVKSQVYLRNPRHSLFLSKR